MSNTNYNYIGDYRLQPPSDDVGDADAEQEAHAIDVCIDALMRNPEFLRSAFASCEFSYVEELQPMIAALIAQDAAGYLAVSRSAFQRIGREWMAGYLGKNRYESSPDDIYNPMDMLERYAKGKDF